MRGTQSVLALALVLAAVPSIAWSKECRGCDAAQEMLEHLGGDVSWLFKPIGRGIPGETVKVNPARRVKNVVIIEVAFNFPELNESIRGGLKFNKPTQDALRGMMMEGAVKAWCHPSLKVYLKQGAVVKWTTWFGPKRDVPIVTEVSRLNCV